MVRSFGMESNDVGASLSKVRDDAVYRLHHQMYINNRIGHWANRFTDQRADRQVGNVMVIHHVKVNDICARSNHIGDFLTQLGEVRGKNTWSNSELFGHDLFS